MRATECAMPRRGSDLEVGVGAGAGKERSQSPRGIFDDDLVEHFQRGYAIEAEVAKVHAEPAPTAERPRLPPEREAERLDVARTGGAVGRRVAEAHDAPLVDGAM